MIPKDGEKGKTPSTQRLMDDSRSTDAERPMQRIFRKSSLFNYLALALAIIAFHAWAKTLPNRRDLSDAQVAVRFTPARFDPAGFAPLRLAGVWKVEIGDSRFGGVSALAVDEGRLLALTDSGTVIRLPKPGEPGAAFVQDLGEGPGRAEFKSNRDSEALARDPAGRGWWVAFESRHQLWLFDPAFRKGLRRIGLGRDRWHHNRGVEGMVADGDVLTLFPESGRQRLELRDGRVAVYRLANRFGSIADAVRLPDGRLLLVTRQPKPGGLAKHLVIAQRVGDGTMAMRPLASLGLGATDNVEAIAAEPHAGGMRLWLMTDNDFRARAPTYLVALDWP